MSKCDTPNKDPHPFIWTKDVGEEGGKTKFKGNKPWAKMWPMFGYPNMTCVSLPEALPNQPIIIRAFQLFSKRPASQTQRFDQKHLPAPWIDSFDGLGIEICGLAFWWPMPKTSPHYACFLLANICNIKESRVHKIIQDRQNMTTLLCLVGAWKVLNCQRQDSGTILAVRLHQVKAVQTHTVTCLQCSPDLPNFMIYHILSLDRKVFLKAMLTDFLCFLLDQQTRVKLKQQLLFSTIKHCASINWALFSEKTARRSNVWCPFSIVPLRKSPKV